MYKKPLKMQALSVLPSSGDCLTVPILKFKLGISRTRRKNNKCWDFGEYSSDEKSSRIFFFSKSSMEVSSKVHCRSSNFDLQHGFFSNHTKLKFVIVCEPKRNSYGASIPMALALEKEEIGSKISEEDLNLRDGLSEKFDGEKVVCISTDKLKDEMEFVSKEEEEEEENCKTGSELGDDKSEKVDVRALGLSLQSAKTADDVEEVLKDFGELPLNVYSSVIRGFGMDKKVESAMAVFEWLKRKRKESDGSIGPNLFIYNSLLGAVKQSHQFGLMEQVMEDMADEGVVPNIVTYNTMMAIHLEQARPNEALNVLEEMQEMGFSPSPVSYSTALLAYRRMEDGNGALKFFVHIKEKYQKGEIGNNDDEDWENEFVKLENFIIRICHQVMRRWLVKGDHLINDVLKLLRDMDSAGLEPGRVDHEKLVWACTRGNHYVVARELYNRIRERESEISLSICNHVIWLLGKAKKWWAALEIYEDLLDKGPRPNNLSNELVISHFNILLTAARKRGIWRWGVRLLNKMEEKGLKPGSREWNAVLVACSKASETSAAVQIFHRMVQNGEKPTILSYGALLSALEKGNLYEEAIRVWEHMIKVGIKPNLYAYTIMTSVYIGQGKSETVDAVMKEMVKSGIEPTVVTFNAIISGCARSSMGGTAFEWFNRMKVWNIPPNEITYEMLIEALARDAKPRLAYELYLRAHNEDLNLSAKAYDAVVESAANYGATIDVSNLGPRPLEKKKQIKARKNLTEFCDLADVPRRSKPFDEEELHAPQIQGNQE